MQVSASAFLQISPNVGLRLKLNPQMYQSLCVLKFSLSELSRYAAEEIAKNPLLEATELDRHSEASWDEETVNKFEYAREVATQDETTLQEHLRRASSLLDLTVDETRVAEEIIGNLNDSGYLAVPLHEIAKACGTTVKMAEQTLRKIQTLDPSGIAARNLQECLLLQLDSFFDERDNTSKSLMVSLIRDHLGDLKNKKYRTILRCLKISNETLQNLISQIRRLDPSPGLSFSKKSAETIVPDITLKKNGSAYRVLYNKDTLPNFRLNPLYRKILGDDSVSTEQRKYLQSYLISGRAFLRAIEQRERTLVRLMRQLVKEQKEFLELGAGAIKPLTLEKIAACLNFHKSTLSRAISHKYVETPHGIFPIKYFFSSSLPAGGGRYSSRGVRHHIQNLIEKENPQHPLTDSLVASVLKSQGICIARRTVAKYRWQLRILPSYLRRP